MPQLETKPFGSIEVSEDSILEFPEGILGFEDYRNFAILEEKEGPFHWLQSADESGLAFIILRPQLILKDYEPAVLPMELQSLQVDNVTECEVYLIVTIPGDHPEKMTANLQGPILVNRNIRQARQVISMNESHLVRVPILELLEA
ncbi:MAG: flagellar assembly protein FliW [Spirochaetaceae bacterium]|nr:flagellar assembly protein FliW [Spirochaetaceae bacterium]|tara:strand:+ start:44378 stop:44815 length:438 start_codon:yes stop_codon:yes gene_type:complete